MTVTDGAGRPLRDGGLARWLAAVAPARIRGEVAIALVTDARVRAFNKRYRGDDRATDVLSFRYDPDAAPVARHDAGAFLGDLLIARGVAARQARGAGHSLQAELRTLALHGLLHLVGYDHDDRADQGRMARVERRLRRLGGLRAGLIERAAPARRRA